MESDPATNITDPEGLLTPPNLLVKIINTARSDLNDSFAIVQSFNPERNRYVVALALPPPATTASTTGLSLRAENLQKASFVEKLKIQALVAKRNAEERLNDPVVREQLRRVYTSVQTRIGFKPEYLVYGFVFFFLVCVKLFGFMKTFMALSFLSLILVVSSPDWTAGNPSDIQTVVQTTVKNFPMRFQFALVQSTGFSRLSERMALGIFIALFLFTAKVLITPVPTKVSKPAAAPATSTQRRDRPSHHGKNIQEIYRLGFDDGSTGKPFGSSLPTDEAVAPPPEFEEDLEWSYNPPPPPPPPPPRKNIMGIGNIMSILYLFRTLKDLAMTQDGQISLALMVANLKIMEPWKLGMLGFCVYKVLSSFF